MNFDQSDLFMNIHTALLPLAKTILLKMLQRVPGFNAVCVFLDA